MSNHSGSPTHRFEKASSDRHDRPWGSGVGRIQAGACDMSFAVPEFMVWEDGRLVSLHSDHNAESILRQIGPV